MLFSDSTCLIFYNDGDSLQYIERDGTESYLTVSSHPNSLMKKITLLNYFRNYMSEHLLKAGANITPREGDELALPTNVVLHTQRHHPAPQQRHCAD